MTIEERRRELLRIIHYAPHTSVSELAMRLEVSERTIRRDLKHIREGGGVPACTKTKGYDVKVDAPGGPLMGLDDAWVIQIVENHPEIGRQDGGLFWRPNSAGYTRFIAEAGIYTEAEAKREQGLTDRPRDVARRLVDVLIGKKIEGSVGAALFEKLTELERLKSALGLPGGPTKDEVVSAYLGDDGRMSVHASTLREAALKVLERPTTEGIPWSDDPLPTDLDYRVNVLWWVDGEDGKTAGPAYIRRWDGPLPGKPNSTGGWEVPSANSILTGPRIIDDEEWYARRRWCAYISPPKALVQ